jgi:hypothetical protein
VRLEKKIHQGKSDERQKSYLCTCKHAAQLNQSPARADAWLSAGDPRWCAVMAVCKIHLGKSDERQKSYLCTCKHAAQFNQLSGGDPRWCAVLAVCNNHLVDLMKDKNHTFAHANRQHS